MRMSTNEKALLAACAGIYLAACVTAEAVAPTPKPATFSSAREKAVVTAQTGHQWPEEPSWHIEELPLTYEEQEALWEACQEFQVDHAVMLALVERETDFRNVQGDGGDSIGYCQIQPRWWSGLMEEIGAEDLTDPEDNFRTACAIMAQLTERYGNVEDALSAYNTGSAGPTKYASAVLSNSAKWEVAR